LGPPNEKPPPCAGGLLLLLVAPPPKLNAMAVRLLNKVVKRSPLALCPSLFPFDCLLLYADFRQPTRLESLRVTA
jgi:hypothetical protein